MNWMQRLCETYNNCQSMVGVETSENEVPLLPVCHTTQKAHITVVIDGEGNFRRAQVVPKNENRTIIPCTEESGGRTSGEAPHPLCDKLQYVASDYADHGGSKKQYSASYISSLEKWCSSEFAHPKAAAVLKYVQKGNVAGDLIDHQVLITGKNGKLLSKWDKNSGNEVPEIYNVCPSQDDAFIRWEVEIAGEPETKVWRDKSLWDSWIQYYQSTRKDKTLCYATGKEEYRALMHPAKLRNDGDKAKLISSNDMDGFTFRGRFLTAEQAAAVGLETTQKAHAALRWLISRQGYRKGDLAVVAWATSGAPVPSPTDDPLAVLGLYDLPSDEFSTISTAQDVALRLKKKIAGYAAELGDTAGIIVMALDSATTGRLAIIYYRQLTGSDFLQRLNDWHESCAWLHSYLSVMVKDTKTGKRSKKELPFIGAPAPIAIAEAAYGLKSDDKIKQATVTRILPCIIEGQQIPRDLVESTVRRACSRVGLEKWEWNKTLSIVCALFRKYHQKENYDMTLELDRTTRDYLYGRLLALADNLEAWALKEAKENRDTNAARLMQRFSEHPYSTWRTIELGLAPYKARLGGKSMKYQRMIDEVIASFNPDDFLNDKRLSGEFLLGYHCQREHLRSQGNLEKETDEETD